MVGQEVVFGASSITPQIFRAQKLPWKDGTKTFFLDTTR